MTIKEKFAKWQEQCYYSEVQCPFRIAGHPGECSPKCQLSHKAHEECSVCGIDYAGYIVCSLITEEQMVRVSCVQ